jgi:hypothetical protein
VDYDKIRDVNPKVDAPPRTLAYEVLGEKFHRGPTETPPKPEEFEFGKKIYSVAQELLAEGKLKAPRIDVNRGGSGLEGVVKGLDELRAGNVSGQKLVYTL